MLRLTILHKNCGMLWRSMIKSQKLILNSSFRSITLAKCKRDKVSWNTSTTWSLWLKIYLFPEKLQVATILNSLPNSFDMVTITMRSSPSLQLSELPTRLGTEQEIMISHRKQELNLEKVNIAHRKLRNDKGQNSRIGPNRAQFKPN